MIASQMRIWFGEGVLSKLATDGVIAFVIKVGSAALAYLMFVALARSMSIAEFGIFGFAFSLAILLARVAGVGQHQLVLRVLPAHESDQYTGTNIGVLRFAYVTTLIGSGIVALACLSVNYLVPRSDELATLPAVAMLFPILAISELQSAVLRADGDIALALAPRELFWRGGVAITGFSIAFFLGPVMTATQAIGACSLVLGIAILGQACMSPLTRIWASLRGKAVFHNALWIRMSGRFWVTALAMVGAANLSVLVVGWLLAPSATAPYFAALKTAQLMNLFLVAANLAAAPVIARHFGQHDLRLVQKICTVLATASGVLSGLTLLALVLFGSALLNVFGAGYDVAYTELLVLGAAFFVTACCGPTAALMEMAGQERAYARIALGSNVATSMALPVAIYLYGAIGGASVVAAGTVIATLWAWTVARRELLIDSSIMSFRLLWQRDDESNGIH